MCKCVSKLTQSCLSRVDKVGTGWLSYLDKFNLHDLFDVNNYYVLHKLKTVLLPFIIKVSKPFLKIIFWHVFRKRTGKEKQLATTLATSKSEPEMTFKLLTYTFLWCLSSPSSFLKDGCKEKCKKRLQSRQCSISILNLCSFGGSKPFWWKEFSG